MTELNVYKIKKKRFINKIQLKMDVFLGSINDLWFNNNSILVIIS